MKYKLSGFGLELSGRCNASCEFCSWGTNKKVSHKNVFTGETVLRSTDNIKKELVDSIFEVHSPRNIIFTGLCEPFSAPEMLFYVADKLESVGGSFSIYSNGNLIKQEDIDLLLEYNAFRSIHISLNAVDDSTRRKVMGLPMSPAEDVLMYLLSKRKELHKEDSTNVGCVFMLTGNNRPEETTFKQKWANIFSNYKNCNPPGVFLTSNWNGESSNPWVSSSGRQYCNQWDSLSPTISSEGQIYLCCYSTHLTFGHCLDDEAVIKWVERKELFGVSREKSKEVPPKELCGSCSAWRYVSWV